jgi:hypothetical protein
LDGVIQSVLGGGVVWRFDEADCFFFIEERHGMPPLPLTRGAILRVRSFMRANNPFPETVKASQPKNLLRSFGNT